ncbi:MAG TPA: ThuA domain-containing protein [Solirubrobacterales bacterium]|nr:ThuA domain-containing protein [Solirubrobacterales bacterium]
MRISARAASAVATATLGLAAAGLIACSSDPEAKPKPRAQVLVFSKTAGFRHDSIPAGIATIRSLDLANGFSVSATEDDGAFTRRRLGRFDAVVFLSTSGDVLSPRQQRAFRSYMRHGGGWVGIHSAADTEYDWPFYGRLLGAYFKQHPAIQPAVVDVTDRSNPSTRHLLARWPRTDEWYDFRANPRGAVHLLATLDESTYSGGTMGADHPIAWCHPFKGGRAWYTAGGHTTESYSEPDFRRHLLGGILWAAGLAKGSCRV